jgi:hypothetical protein
LYRSLRIDEDDLSDFCERLLAERGVDPARVRTWRYEDPVDTVGQLVEFLRWCLHDEGAADTGDL